MNLECARASCRLCADVQTHVVGTPSSAGSVLMGCRLEPLHPVSRFSSGNKTCPLQFGHRLTVSESHLRSGFSSVCLLLFLRSVKFPRGQKPSYHTTGSLPAATPCSAELQSKWPVPLATLLDPGRTTSRGVQPFGVFGPHWKKKKSCLGPHIKSVVTRHHKIIS